MNADIESLMRDHQPLEEALVDFCERQLGEGKNRGDVINDLQNIRLRVAQYAEEQDDVIKNVLDRLTGWCPEDQKI